MNTPKFSQIEIIARAPFLLGVFLLSTSVLIFQIVQTRILSVVAWYYMAFFAISVSMLGMTAGAVWVYLRKKDLRQENLPQTLSRFAIATAVAMPGSVMLQFCLMTALSLSLTTVIAWSLLLSAMAVPYIFSGVVVSLALTRSPFPTGQVYGVDLLGAAIGCISVVFVMNALDGPTAIIAAGALAGVSAILFASSSRASRAVALRPRSWWVLPIPVTIALIIFAILNGLAPIGVRPIWVKKDVELSGLGVYEKWNSYSRVLARRPTLGPPLLWGPSPTMPSSLRVLQSDLNIDGAASTTMSHYDGTPASISFLQYDLTSLAYRLPGIHKSAVIGVGGGRDIMTAYLFGVPDVTGVELNPIFIHLLTADPFFKAHANITAFPNLKFHVDDARSWFASTPEKFDLVQMSMIDTWAATGAGAYSLSENGLYTIEGWRAFLRTLNPNGIFTVSRWYSPGDVNETGRMIGLATAALMDTGIRDVRPHLFVARSSNIATLVLSKSSFTPEQITVLDKTVSDYGFNVLLSPHRLPESPLLREIVESNDRTQLDRALSHTYLDMSVTTDNRPFFFNQLKIGNMIPVMVRLVRGTIFPGVLKGNLLASAMLVLILFISIVAVIATILVPLRGAAGASDSRLLRTGSLYFSLIGIGFMLAEISLLQHFSVYLGHPVYSLSICLFSLILSLGLGSLTSDRLSLNTSARVILWSCLVAGYLIAMQAVLPALFAATTARERPVRIVITIVSIVPLGFLMGFAFPTGMRLVEAVDTHPTPWFWGINGATGVLASVVGVMSSMWLGIHITMVLAAICYLLLIPAAIALLRMSARANRAADDRIPVLDATA